MTSLKYYFFCFLVLLSNKIFSQNFTGIGLSNYGGTYATSLNPANVVDTRTKVFVNLAGLDAHLTNNYAAWNAPFSFIDMVAKKVPATYLKPNGNVNWLPNYAEANTNVKNISAFFSTTIKGPSIQFESKKYKMGFAVGYNNKTLASITNASEMIGDMILNGTSNPTKIGPFYTNNHLKFNAVNYNEYYASLGYIINQSDEHFIKAGVTLKMLSSNLNLLADATQLDYVIGYNPSNPSKQDIYMAVTKGSYAAAQSADFALSSSWITKQLTSFKGVGNGFGADLGVVYEFRPNYDKFDYREKGILKYDPTVNKYQYKVGFSLIDIGKIVYKDNVNVNAASINSTANTIDHTSFDGVNTPNEFNTAMTNVYALSAASVNHKYSVFLPASAVINADLAVTKNFFFGFLLKQSIPLSKSYIFRTPSRLTILPRYERKWFEVALPVVVDNNYKNVSFGAYARVGGLFVGSDNLGGLLNIAKPRGLDIYGGLFIPIFYKQPQTITDCPSTDYSPKKKGFSRKRKR